VNRSVGSLGSRGLQRSRVRTRDRSKSEVGAISPRFDHHDGRHLGHVPPSTNPSRGRSNAHDLRPLCLVDRVPNPIPRPREGRCDRRTVDWVTRGVRESSSRGYVPLLLTVGGQPLDSLGFPAGVRASEAGVFGDAAHRSHSSRPPSKGFSRPSKMEPRIHAMRANSGARRQVDRQQGRYVAKTREASPREATSCRDLVRRAARRTARE